MAKHSYRLVSLAQRNSMLHHVAHALIALKDEKTMSLFLQRLLTPSEVVMISRRLKIARQLIDGESYRDIRQALGAGVSTIASVDSWLQQALGNYRSSPIKKASRDKARPPRIKPSPRDIVGTFSDTRHRYGSHYLLLNLPQYQKAPAFA